MGKDQAAGKGNWTREELEKHREELAHQLVQLERSRDNLVAQTENVRGAVSLLTTLLRQEEAKGDAS